MLVTKYDPFKRFASMQKELDNFNALEEQSSLGAFVPKVNTREGEFAYHVDVDLPGIKKKDINIDVRDNTLSISGERNFKEEVNEEDYYKVESSFGRFERLFTLPDSVDIENISAATKDGVLEVVIPKIEKKEAKKTIKIK